MKKMVLGLLGLSFCLGYSETDNSRIYLARAFEQIQAAQELVLKASKYDTEKNKVEVFKYEYLEEDLSNIGKSIQNYLNDVRISPNDIQTLNSNYTNQQ